MATPQQLRPRRHIEPPGPESFRALGRTFPSRTNPPRAPEALLHVGGDGTCLEVISFEEFAALPRPSALIGAQVGEVLPPPIGHLAKSAMQQPRGGVSARELMSGRRRLRVEVRPSRDETCWVRLTDVTELNRRANEPDLDLSASTSAPADENRVRLDETGRVQHWGAAVAQLTGVPAQQAIGRPLAKMTTENDAWTRRVSRAIPLGADEHKQFDEWLWRGTGRRHFVSMSLARSAGGYTLSVRDLTALRLRDSRAATLSAVSRAALDASTVENLAERTLTAMCETLDWEVGVFWEVDEATNLMRCRRIIAPTALDLGRELEDRGATVAAGVGLAGRVWADGYADSEVDGFRAHPVFSRHRFVDELRSSFAFPVRAAHGIFGVFEFASRAVEDTGTELLRTAAIVSDYISQFADRLRAEEALRASDAQKAAILSNALDGIVTIDGRGRVVELNAEAERTFGVAPNAMLGRDLADFTAAADDRTKLEAELASLAELAATSAQVGRRLQVRAVRADGEELPADLSITRIPLAGPPLFSVCVRDLSEQERLQGALHHAQKMESLGLLASGIAHDFNNFLTVIRGQAERLLKNLPDEDARRRWVGSILKVSERASALTGQLLAFGRREASTGSVVDLNSIVESTAGLLSQQLGDRIIWDATLAPDAGRARIAEGQVQQILFNLALNARDAMPDGGRLSVVTRPVELGRAEARRLLLAPGTYIQLTVRDTGRGMDARTQDRVFEPFFTTKKLGEGTGLGLSTVYALVQQCGGQISVSSRVGQGTTFDVYLPRVASTEAQGTAAPRASSGHELSGLTILLVEDEEEIREIMSDALTERGGQVIAATDGESALEHCARHGQAIDLLVTDVMMPGMNGHQLAELITGQRPELPVIFVSGHPEAAVGPHRLHGRAVSLLRKPFSSDELVRRVKEAADTAGRLSGRSFEPRPESVR